MDIRIPNIRILTKKEFPAHLLEIPEPPEQLYLRGTMPPEDTILLAVVGSRKYTNYGKDVCEELIAGLAGYPISIVSGLALGIDAIAHRAALKACLPTIAVPGSGLNDDAIYPAAHFGLAQEILANGGALLSEFESNFRATQWAFPKRNRIMAGLCRAVLIIEAEERSGTLITARLALDYNRDVFVVPNSIFADGSKGSNRLVRQGAMPVLSSEDILNELGLTSLPYGGATSVWENCSVEERMVLDLLSVPLPRDDIIRALNLPAHETNALLSAMEIKNLLKEEMGVIRKK